MKHCLLDSSFVIDLLNEVCAASEVGSSFLASSACTPAEGLQQKKERTINRLITAH
jgi:hypothetical protein